MKKIWPWIIGITILLLVGMTILFGTGLLRSQRMPMYWVEEGQREWRDNFWHHPGMGMHSGYWRFSVMGLFGGLLMLVFPLALLALIVLGIVLLVRSSGLPGQGSSRPVTAHCHKCGKQIESDWQICPYCGEHLGKE